MKKFCLLFLALAIPLLGKCKKPDHNHGDKNIVRCNYKQEDIYRAYSKKVHNYNDEQRRKECFYCGCAIEDHTKAKSAKKVKK